jgi:hypothetical protein
MRRSIKIVPDRYGWRIWLLAILALSASFSAIASDWKDALKETLEGVYPLTHRSALAPDRLTNQGVVLVIQKQGIAADPSSDMRYSVTYVHDGQIGEEGGATAAIFTKEKTRTFKPGEKVYVTAIKIGEDYVMLELMSCDMFDIAKSGSTKQTRYKSALSFKFDKNALPTLDAKKVIETISTVAATEAEAAAKTQKLFPWGRQRRRSNQSWVNPTKL